MSCLSVGEARPSPHRRNSAGRQWHPSRHRLRPTDRGRRASSARRRSVPAGDGWDVGIESRRRRALTVDEWQRLYESATGTTKLFIDLCGRHGLRPQEAWALTWSAVDLDAGTISVITQLDSDDRFVDPKTRGSTRTIQAHAGLIEDLAAWRDRQAIRRSDSWTDQDLIIATRNGTPVSQENQRRSLTVLCERADVDLITPYELRHTALTHQVEAGHGVSNIADWAGTSEKMIYEHYRHRIASVSFIPPAEFQ